MSMVAGITLGIALLGAVLGIINTWHTIDTRRVKLRVTPKLATFYPSEEKTLCIEVVNLSAFPVTIGEIGFLSRWPTFRRPILRPITLNGGDFPRRLDSRSAFTAHTTDLMNDPETLSEIRCAFAKTDCGVLRKGNSGALKSIVRTARDFRDKSPTTN